MIKASNLCRSFGGKQVVNKLNFSIESGEIVGFLGPNGAGKTTTMRLLTTYLAPTGGVAQVAGWSITDDPDRVARSIGYLPESMPIYPEMLVGEYLGFRSRLKGLRGGKRQQRIEALAQRCSISDQLRKPMRHLSRGYRQRVGLADALLTDPEILILDEPTAGLDPKQVTEVRNLISSFRGTKTVLFSSHILGEIEQVCDRIIIMAQGRIRFDDRLDEWRSHVQKQRRVVVEFSEFPEAAVEEILKFEGVTKAVRIGESLRVESGLDLRGTIFNWCAKRGWPLISLYEETPKLEELFLSATGEEAAS